MFKEKQTNDLFYITLFKSVSVQTSKNIIDLSFEMNTIQLILRIEIRKKICVFVVQYFLAPSSGKLYHFANFFYDEPRDYFGEAKAELST